MLLTSISEVGCFSIGTISSMPAVNTFALFATLALLFNIILQMTMFVALLTLDERRYEVNHFLLKRINFFLYKHFQNKGQTFRFVLLLQN